MKFVVKENTGSFLSGNANRRKKNNNSLIIKPRRTMTDVNWYNNIKSNFFNSPLQTPDRQPAGV